MNQPVQKHSFPFLTLNFLNLVLNCLKLNELNLMKIVFQKKNIKEITKKKKIIFKFFKILFNLMKKKRKQSLEQQLNLIISFCYVI